VSLSDIAQLVGTSSVPVVVAATVLGVFELGERLASQRAKDALSKWLLTFDVRKAGATIPLALLAQMIMQLSLERFARHEIVRRRAGPHELPIGPERTGARPESRAAGRQPQLLRSCQPGD
jgi:hypothetical protein